MKRNRHTKRIERELSAVEQVMRLVPVGGWIGKANGDLTISDGKKSHSAPSYEELLPIILQSPFSPSASHQTDQQPSALTEDSRDE